MLTRDRASRDTDADRDGYDAHLERSRRVWDRWSDRYGMSERDFEPIRAAAIDRLSLEPGDRVLEIGCGPGVNLERLGREIGATGELVAVDYSPRMVEKARERVDEHGLENVTVRRCDATTAAFDGEFDAALASLSLSVMPDVRAATENVYRSLAPGGTFVVVDVGEIPNGPARLLNPLLRRFYRWYANWNPDGDVLEALETTFDESEVVDRSFLGSAYTVHCRKR